jgi:hypothetical protein
MRSGHSFRRTRKAFENLVDEEWYLADKVSYWLYVRKRPATARRFAKRLADLLRRERYSRRAILDQTFPALVAEALGDCSTAIEYRSREVRLRRRVLAYATTAPEPDRRNLLEDFPAEHVLSSLGALARVQVAANLARRATRTMSVARRFAESHGLSEPKRWSSRSAACAGFPWSGVRP